MNLFYIFDLNSLHFKSERKPRVKEKRKQQTQYIYIEYKKEAAVESAVDMHTNKSHTCAQIDTRISCNKTIYENPKTREKKATIPSTNKKAYTQNMNKSNVKL